MNLKTPPAIRLRRREDGLLLFEREGIEKAVTLRLCFPWSFPRQYLSLRDEKGEEVALIPDLDALPEKARVPLEAALEESRFTFVITSIESIAKDFELRVWKVKTVQGERTFQTKLDEWPRELADEGVVIRDLSGDLYHIPDPHTLDKKSSRLLWAFTD